MARPKQTITDGHKWCDYHLKMESVGTPPDYDDGDFEIVRRDRGIPIFAPRCRLAQQSIRDENRNGDPARYSIISRAKRKAREIGGATGSTISYHWVLDELLYKAFTPILRVLIAPSGLCLNCGRHWDDPEKWELEHRFPASSLSDWACQHARNLWLACGGCNNSKQRHDADRDWLEQEQRKWMKDRNWASQAGSKGWPPYESYFGEPPATSTAWTESNSGLIFPEGTLFTPWD